MNIPTANHKKLIKVLNQLGLMIDTEVRVGNYSLDCYCYDLHLGFEADTRRTHMRGRDKKRDAWIMDNFNIPILRVDIMEYKDKETLNTKIIDFISKWAHSADERKGGFVPIMGGSE